MRNRLVSPRLLQSVTCEVLESRRLLAAVAWDGGGDGASWNDPENWSADSLPTADDDVTINVPANPTVLLFGTPATVNSLSSSETLRITTSLTVHTTTALNAPTRLSGYASLALDGNLTVNDTLTLGNAADNTYGFLSLQGNSNVAVLGTGSILAAGDSTSYIYNSTYDSSTGTGKTVTLGNGLSISGKNLIVASSYQGASIVSAATLNANVAGGNWSLGNGNTAFTNAGALTVNGPTVTLSGAWNNTASVSIVAGTLNLGGTFSPADVGTLSHAGGDVTVTGIFDLGGATFTLNAARGSWGIGNGGRIANGTLARLGQYNLLARGGILDAVTLNLPVTVDAYNALNVEHGITLNDTLTLGNAADNTYGFLSLQGNSNVAVLGTGSILAAGDSTSYIYNSTYDSSTGTGKTVTLGNGLSISGKNLIVASSYQGASIVSAATLNANVAGGNWSLGNGNTAFTNAGALTVNGPTVTLSGAWNNTASVSIVAGTLNLGGTFSPADVGTLSHAGGDVTVTGIFDLGGATFTLNAARGSWGIGNGGRIANGTLARLGQYNLLARGGILDTVTLNLPVTVDAYNALNVEHGITLNDTLTLGNAGDNTYGVLSFAGETDQTLGGTGEVLAVGDGLSYINNLAQDSSSGTTLGKRLTVGSGIEITGKNLYLTDSYSSNQIANNGTIGSTVLGGNFFISGSDSTSFVNTGKLVAQNGGQTHVTNLSGNLNGITLTGVGSVLDLQGTYVLNATNTVGNDALLIVGGSWQKTGTLDLGGAAIFDYATGGISPLSTLYSQVITGRNGGTWNGAGIRSTRAASTPGYVVGIGEASTILSSSGGTFAGSNVDGSAVLVRLVRAGDANLDGSVGFSDLLKLAQNFSRTNAKFTDGDFDYDGDVDFSNLLSLAQNFNQPLSVTTPLSSATSKRRNKSPELV